MTRYASVLRMPPENLVAYTGLHAAVWPGVLARITECGIRNYSIYHRGGWLFSYYEYVGHDYEADMARMAGDPTTQEWWAINKPLQEPLEDRAPGEWWAAMDELFHQD
jgi:L-rhamnose mutarotase